MKIEFLPQVLFLYGPAGCGKGTQALALLKEFPHYKYIELGEVFREFVKNNKDGIGEKAERARKMNETMAKGQPIDLEGLSYIWESEVQPYLDSGLSLLVDGVFRGYEQSLYLSQKIAESTKLSALCVLHITADESIARLSSRYYVEGSRQPYKSFEEALPHAPEGTQPFSRSDDASIETIRNRYQSQYEFQFGKCISLYQRVTAGDVYIVNGEESEDQVTTQIIEHLSNFSKRFTRLSS